MRIYAKKERENVEKSEKIEISKISEIHKNLM